MPPSRTKAAPRAVARKAPPPVASPLFTSPAEGVPAAPVLEGTVLPPGAAYDIMNPSFPSWLTMRPELVTPEIARQYLAKMKEAGKQRAVSRLNAGTAEENLREGQWFPDISVAFFVDDVPVDGMHRYGAIAETGIPAYILAVRGVRPAAEPYIDTGRGRSWQDTVKMAGYTYYANRAALSRQLAIYERYGMNGTRYPSQYVVTRSDMEAWLDAPGVEQSIKLANAMHTEVGGNSNIAAFMLMVTGAGQDPDGFWGRVRSGENLTRVMPEMTLNKWLTRSSLGARNRTQGDPRLLELHAWVVCWNKHVLGQEYASVQPTFEKKKKKQPKDENGIFFPARNIPDILPLGFDAHAELAQFAGVFAALRGGREGEPQQVPLDNGE